MLFHEKFIVSKIDLVIDVILSEFSEEKATPYSDLFHGWHLFQLVDIALPIVNVKRIDIV